MTTVLDMGRMAALGVMVAADRGARTIARRLKVRSDNRVEFVGDVWCIGSDGDVYYRDRHGYIAKGYCCPPQRWGRWVVASEHWYDGGGTTYILRADREMRGAEAHSMEREHNEWLRREL